MTDPSTPPPQRRKPRANVIVRNTQPEDFDAIIDICRRVYTTSPPWKKEQLESHLRVFPEGQLVAVDQETSKVVAMAASLIVLWDDYELNATWRDFTDNGYFTNHDPEHGRTLYGAEIMVDPSMQGRGVGKAIYVGRRQVCRQLKLLRIRAGARLRGYGKYADQMGPEDYVRKVVNRELGDPTLSFQLREGFRVIGVTKSYLGHDEESRGYAAVIEWINHEVAQPRDYRRRDPLFARKRKPPPAPEGSPSKGPPPEGPLAA